MKLFTDLLVALSRSIDLVDVTVGDHNKRVAYITACIAKEMDADDTFISRVVRAAALHDVGVLKEQQYLELKEFDYKGGVDYHSILGFRLLESCELTKDLAEIIKYHHIKYSEQIDKNLSIPLESEIIHIADRFDVLLNYREDLLYQKSSVLDRLLENAGQQFNPTIIEYLRRATRYESFWFDLQFNNIDKTIHEAINISPYIELSLEQILDFAALFTKIIDFRSRFTATHSTSVAYVARELGKLLNFSELECKLLDIAGHLHDIGKLAIPLSILEKHAGLSKQEWKIMQRHSYVTYTIIERITHPRFATINEWASFHHETLDGKGYPFKVDANNLSMGSRILAIADIFTALAESRPYRPALEDDTILNELNKLKGTKLDPYLLEIVQKNYELLKQTRRDAFTTAQNNFSMLFDTIY